MQDTSLYAHDGMRLALSIWPARAPVRGVIVGLHGVNDYAGAFRWAAPCWAEQGYATYAWDQRGFGRSAPMGRVWYGTDKMVADIHVAIQRARLDHPAIPLCVLGISMGAAIAVNAFASDRPPQADRLVLSAPGFWGWGALPLTHRLALRITCALAPGLTTHRPFWVRATNNDGIQRIQDRDPCCDTGNRADFLYEIVSVMEEAHLSVPRLPACVPTLVLRGGRDTVIPARAFKRTARLFPEHVQVRYYAEGYHLLLRDREAKTRYADVLHFIEQG